jgi:hypothetical protein
VKIGLVKAPRTSDDRLIEHQTGNPRRLTIPTGHIVSTEAVSLVEAQLHRRFARDRVGGEWFKFKDDSLLVSAIDAARALAEEVGPLMPLLRESESLEQVASNGLEIAPNEIASRQALLLADAKEKEKSLKALAGEVKELLAGLAESGGDLGTSATVRKITFKAKFDEATFLSDYPEEAEKYYRTDASWFQRFNLTYKLPAEYQLDEAFTAAVAEIRDLLPSSASDFTAIELVEPSLRLTQLEAIVDWEAHLAEAKLKIECGPNDAITGICNWKRRPTEKRVFDAELLLTKDYELYKQYLLDEVTKEYIIPAKGSKRK